MKKFRDQTRRYLAIHRADWSDHHDRIIGDYLSDDGKPAMFATFAAQQGAVRIEWNLPGIDSPPGAVCFFVKMEAGPYLRPDQFEASFYHGSYVTGTSDVIRHWTRVGRHFEEQALMSGTRLVELKHLMEVNLLKLRLHLVGRQSSLDEAVLLKPSLVPPPPVSDEDDEDRIELLERNDLTGRHINCRARPPPAGRLGSNKNGKATAAEVSSRSLDRYGARRAPCRARENLAGQIMSGRT